MNKTPTVIDVEGVSVGYGDAPIVRDVSLRITAGEFAVILGENGSGKSTLVKGILGLASVTAGQVHLFGQVASAELRHRIGYVPQRSIVTGGTPVTVREVVASGRVARRRWFAPATKADRDGVNAALAAVRLSDRANDTVWDLSGGQQRRALIARALASEPELLVMDEPTAGVDAVTVELLAEAAQRWKQAGLTVLLVAHGIGPLRPLVDRALVMGGGRLRYDGPFTAAVAGDHDDHVADDHHEGHGPSFVVPDGPVWGTQS